MSNIRFDKRVDAARPIRVFSYRPGDNIRDWDPDVGDTACPNSGAVTVLAHITAVIGRSYTGEAIGFERWQEYELGGLKPGDQIEFSYAHIFGCNR